jgi:cystathionine beta-synthase
MPHMKEDLNVYDNALALIGNTPLIKLNKITSNFKGNFFAKVEGFNPGHSSKDRIALYIIEEAERKGILNPGDTIIETTSGNTGFSLAMVSIVKGYKCKLALTCVRVLWWQTMVRNESKRVVALPTDNNILKH